MVSLSTLLSSGSLSALAQSVRNTLNTLQGQINTAWTKQHADDGTHTDVTAASVRSSWFRPSMARGTDTQGAIFVYDARNAAANGIPLNIAAGVQWISIIVPAPGPWLLRGIVQPGVQFGDVIFVRRDPRSAANIEITDRDAANVPIGSEIHVPQDVSLSYPVFTIPGPCWVPMIYTPGAGTNSVPAWALLQTMSA